MSDCIDQLVDIGSSGRRRVCPVAGGRTTAPACRPMTSVSLDFELPRHRNQTLCYPMVAENLLYCDCLDRRRDWAVFVVAR